MDAVAGRVRQRAFPLVATVVLAAVGIAVTTWWGPRWYGTSSWQLPDDLWGTLVAARRLADLDLAHLYTAPTGLVSFPGAAAILVPIVAITDGAGMSLAMPGPHNPHPAVWLAAGTYQILLSGTVLFAADALAERLGACRRQRFVLAAAGAVALWSVSVRWGHPEDAVAVALLLYGILALSRERTMGSAWLVGAAVAVQPVVLLAVPLVMAVVDRRRIRGYLVRAAAPSLVLLGVAAAANWSATRAAVTDQPNWPAVDHPTPFLFSAPRLGHGAVAAGPARVVAIGLACACAVVVARRLRQARTAGGWGADPLEELLWWTAVVLALRSVFESVMASYYIWPVLAVGLVAAARHWTRLLATAAVAATLTLVAQASWRGQWTWWGAMVVGLAALLAAAHPALGRTTARLRRAQPVTAA